MFQFFKSFDIKYFMIKGLNNQSNIMPEFFALMLGVFLGFIVFFSKLGFENDIFLIIKSIFLLFIIIFSPYLINIFFYKNSNYFLSKPFLNFISLILVIVLSEISFFFNIDFSYFFLFLGTIIFLLTIKYFFKIFFSYDIIFLIFILIFAIWSISAYSTNRYIHPLIIEKIISGAWAHRDILWHASLAGMIKTYGITGSGIDGLVHYNYHTFSNFFVAKLSALLNTNTFNFYGCLFPIIIIPLFFLNFIFAVYELNIFFQKKFLFKLNIYSNYFFWISLLCLFALPLPYNWFGVQKYEYLYSTSYCFAFLFTFILIANLAYLLNLNFKIDRVNFQIIVIIIFLSLLYYIITISKFSFLYFVVISYIFFYFRLKLYKKLFFNLLGFAIFSVSLYTYFTILYKFQLESSSHGFSASLLQKYLFTSQKYYMYLYGTLMLFFIKILSLRIFNLKKFLVNIRNLNLIELEYLFYLAIALLIFPWPYTNGIQIPISYLFLLSQLSLIKRIYKDKI